MLTTQQAQHQSLGKEGASYLRALYCAHCQKDLFHPLDLVITIRSNELKSIRLNPNNRLARLICADSAGYAPQALVPLYDVI